jgi:hypothetical protein
MDFGAQTITTINNAAKTYTVKKFSDVAGAAGNTDVMSMDMDMDMGRGGPPMKMQVEMDLWISCDVSGAEDMRAFYRKNLANFPWAAISGGADRQPERELLSPRKCHR